MIITLNEYKAYALMPEANEKEDGKLSVLVNAANNLIQAYIGHTLSSWEDYVEEIGSFDYPSDTYFTNIWPIRDVQEIVELYRPGYDSSVHWVLDPSEYVVLEDRIVRIPGSSGFSKWPVGPSTIKITYRGGYEDGNPEDIKLAAFELVNYYREQQFKQSKTVMGTTVSNSLDYSAGWPAHIRLLLDGYK